MFVILKYCTKNMPEPCQTRNCFGLYNSIRLLTFSILTFVTSRVMGEKVHIENLVVCHDWSQRGSGVSNTGARIFNVMLMVIITTASTRSNIYTAQGKFVKKCLAAT